MTGTGFSIYGLSTDSTKSNTTFKTKQHLPYTLLCDHSATLIAAIGMKKAPKGTTRGVFVVSKDGKILAAEAGVGLFYHQPKLQSRTDSAIRVLQLLLKLSVNLLGVRMLLRIEMMVPPRWILKLMTIRPMVRRLRKLQ